MERIAIHLELNVLFFISLNNQETVRKPDKVLSPNTAMKWMPQRISAHAENSVYAPWQTMMKSIQDK